MRDLTQSAVVFIRNKREIFYFVAYLVVMVIADILIHETGHFLAALVIGVPANEIKFRFVTISPEITLPSRFSNNVSLTFYQYAGGVFAAIVLLVVYLLFWYRKYRANQTGLIWALGFATILLCGEEIGNAIYEGGFHGAYMHYINSPFSIIDLLILSCILMGFVVHLRLFPLSKLKKKVG
jgi:TctA family transporter